MTQPADVQHVLALEAAAEVAGLLARLWRGQAHDQILADGDYTPENVDDILRHWTELRAAAEGATQGFEPGAGHGDRIGIATLLADVTWATDAACVGRLHWRATARLYRRQDREHVLLHRRRLLARAEASPRIPEPASPYAHEQLVERIASALGWGGYS